MSQPDLHRIDLDHLRRYTGDDEALTAEVLGMFGEQVGMWLRMLDPEGDREAWRSAAHAIKGSAATVGAARLAGLCARAEATEADAAGRAWLRDEIEAEAGEVRAEIARWEYARVMRGLSG